MRPARTAITCGAGGHSSTPPSEPTHGVGPAPRHGVAGRWPWAQSAVALSKIPHIASSKNLLRIAWPPLQFERSSELSPSDRAGAWIDSTGICVMILEWGLLYTRGSFD